MKILDSYQPYRFQPAFRLLDFMRQLGDPETIMLGAGIPDPALLPGEAIIESFHEANRVTNGGYFGYQTPEGDPELRHLISERMKTRGIDDLEGDSSVILTTGCTQALHLALRTRVKPGDTVAVECPCYYHLLEQISSLGANILPIPADMNEGIDLERGLELLKNHQARCLVLCSTLSNPSGATMPVSVRPQLVDGCRKLGVTIIEDDIYAELHDDGASPPLRAFDDGGTVTLVSSFCKTVAPGLRVGFILPGPDFEVIAAERCMMDMHGGVVAEVTLREYLKRPDSKTHLEKMKGIFQKRRRILRDAVEDNFPTGTVVSCPAGGFLLWAVLPFLTDSGLMHQRALEQKVTFADGKVFLPAAPTRTAMRLNAGKASEQNIVRGIQVLSEIIEDAPACAEPTL
ncbi:MAG: PLP-dependent aminotransferase family protein [Verrucomicrobiota bacterium]